MDARDAYEYHGARVAPVAQLDRVLPSEGSGRGFESRLVHHLRNLDLSRTVYESLQEARPVRAFLFLVVPKSAHQVRKSRDADLALVNVILFFDSFLIRPIVRIATCRKEPESSASRHGARPARIRDKKIPSNSAHAGRDAVKRNCLLARAERPTIKELHNVSSHGCAGFYRY